MMGLAKAQKPVAEVELAQFFAAAALAWNFPIVLLGAAAPNALRVDS
jgi:hypothetical protein